MTVKSSLIVASLAVCFAFSACESTPDLKQAIHNRFAPTYQTHDVACDARRAYESARAALADFGFHQTSGGPAQGYIEALDQVNPQGPNGVARQVSLRVNFSVSTRVPNGTEVSALFKSIEEDSTNPHAGATQVPLIDSPLYEVFFSHLDARLSKSAP